MDHRQLLLKYINHVGMSGGETYIDLAKECGFTDEEVAELRTLDRRGLIEMRTEIRQRRRRERETASIL